MSEFPLKNLLLIKRLKSLKLAYDNPPTVYTVKAWQIVRTSEGRSQTTSVFTPICDNPDFSPGMTDNGFGHQKESPICVTCSRDPL